jgi:2,4-dienoyl-CoA reductase-like NADH-dependent reductase (Old Yellow Enzyme family)/thioredoxin reductase
VTDPHPRYPHLLSPIDIGPRTMKNRVWMTAHGTQLVKDHNFTEPHVGYYAERAKGGVGAITMEAMAVHETTQPYLGKIFAFSERVVPNYRKIAAEVQSQGALVFAQPWHRGRQMSGKASRLPTWAPSPVPDAVYREVPHQMTAKDIDEIIAGYVASAHFAVEGGLDGVEVHGFAHGYLLGQFLSPATNHRVDGYGGSHTKRLRLAMEILRAVRDEVGSQFVVGVRINSDDGPMEEGLRSHDWARIAASFAESGLIDYVSVSQGTYLDRMLIYGATPKEAGYQLKATAQVKEAVPELPVIAAGRINTPEIAERAIESGAADIVGLSRPLIADPEWVAKAEALEDERIRPCVGANWCLAAITDSPLACIHNPAVAREKELGTGSFETVETPKRVVVVGGGPAGLRAAHTAARQGHHVELYEAGDELGGRVTWLSRVEAYSEYYGIVSWLLTELEELGVKLHTGRRLSADDVRALEPEAVIVATGSDSVSHGWSALHPANWAPGHPSLPGSDQWNVITPQDIFEGSAELGASIVVYDDIGDRQAVAVAEYLADRRHRVSVVTRLGQVAPALAASRDLGPTIGRLRRKGVELHIFRELVGIEEDRATVRDVHTDELEVIEPADNVVLVTGQRARDGLAHELSDAPFEVLLVGDAMAPRNIFSAVWDGEQAARSL